MASSEVTEVLGYSEEIVSDDMIEIHNDTLDMPVECVQEVVTDSNFHFGDHQIIYGDELIVSSEDVPQSEEIVGSDSDPYVGLYVPVPTAASDVLDSSNLRNFVNMGRGSKNKSALRLWRVNLVSQCGLRGRMMRTEKMEYLKLARMSPPMRPTPITQNT